METCPILESVIRQHVSTYHVLLIPYISMKLVLLVGSKLQHIIATLALESAAITGYYNGAKLKPRDDLFWFKKPELLLSLIHFILFQVVAWFVSCDKLLFYLLVL